ncbi:MAG: Pup--protein ligase [Actinomycetales bacterium]|nr:Pup--protein ligase [Actinomycetales bacterium]
MPIPLPARIFGIETEYGISCQIPNKRQLNSDELAKYLFSDIVAQYRSNNVFLPNGGRLYLDVGSHPEYATAECDQLEQVIAQELAGDQLVLELARHAEAVLASEGLPAKVFIFKNNTDSAGNSFGCHENYLIRRRPDGLAALDTLLPFLVTRQLLVGAGKLLKTSTGVQYVMSQRAEHLWDSVSSATTRSRPMINTRDEPHADSDKFRRLHVISADSNRSQVAQLLKVALMDLLLAVLESGALQTGLRLDNPMRAIRDVSRDLTGRALVVMADGSTMTALEIQQWYLEHITRTVERQDWQLSRLHQFVLNTWSQLLHEFATGEFNEADRVVDWRIKKLLIDTFANRHNLQIGDFRLQELEFKYHELNHGVFETVTQSLGLPKVIADHWVTQAKTQPPQSTRAKLRSDFILWATESKQSFAVDWMHLKVTGASERGLTLPDPFAAQDSRFKDFLGAV